MNHVGIASQRAYYFQLLNPHVPDDICRFMVRFIVSDTNVGDLVDVKDRCGLWLVALIINRATDVVRIHYIGFSTLYREYISLHDPRINSFGERTDGKLFVYCGYSVVPTAMLEKDQLIMYNTTYSELCHWSATGEGMKEIACGRVGDISSEDNMININHRETIIPSRIGNPSITWRVVPVVKNYTCECGQKYDILEYYCRKCGMHIL